MTRPSDDSTVTDVGRNLLPIASGVGMVLSALLPVLDLFGVQLPETLATRVSGLIGALFLLFGLIYSRLRTTPLVDPRDAHGTPLVPQAVTRTGDAATLRRDPRGTDG